MIAAKTQSRAIPDGVGGIEATLRQMAYLARQGVRSPEITILSREITSSVPTEEDKLAEARAIFEWVKNNIRYVRDPVEIELIMRPEKLLAIKAGDCDDLSILIAALAESVGIPARFTAVQTHQVRPGEDRYNHVYPELWAGGKWYPADRANASPKFGRAPYSEGSKLIQPITISGEPTSMGDMQRTVTFGGIVVGLIVIGGVIYLITRATRRRRYAKR